MEQVIENSGDNTAQIEVNGEENITNTTAVRRRRTLQAIRVSRQLQVTSQLPVNFEEQIIKNRGRRTNPVPQTPPSRKFAQKRANDEGTPKESPFTKCLRGAISPVKTTSTSRLLLSTETAKRFYYSPNPPYRLRSLESGQKSAGIAGTSSTESSFCNDSGIAMTPDTVSISTPSDQIDSSVTSTGSSSSSSLKRFSRVRRRFRF